MTHRLLIATAALLAVSILAACASGSEPAAAGASQSDVEGNAANQSDPATEGDAPGDGGGGTATISLTLTGGPHDGTYEAEAPDGGCSRNSVGDNTFGLQYSVAETEGFTSHQLIIRDAAAAVAGGGDDFVTDVIIDDAIYGIDTGAGVMNDPSGSGVVTLDDRGDTATITSEGETGEGVGFNAEVECHAVSE